MHEGRRVRIPSREVHIECLLIGGMTRGAMGGGPKYLGDRRHRLDAYQQIAGQDIMGSRLSRSLALPDHMSDECDQLHGSNVKSASGHADAARRV